MLVAEIMGKLFAFPSLVSTPVLLLLKSCSFLTILAIIEHLFINLPLQWPILPVLTIRQMVHCNSLQVGSALGKGAQVRQNALLFVDELSTTRVSPDYRFWAPFPFPPPPF